jgi:hypothetical protein
MTHRPVQIRDTQCQSSAECLLRLGSLARYLMRHGSAPDQVASQLEVGSRACALALAFLSAPALLRFRALVEEWNLLAIRSRLRALQRGSLAQSCGRR